MNTKRSVANSTIVAYYNFLWCSEEGTKGTETLTNE